MKRWNGKAIYAGTIVAMLALVAGFVAATVAITNSSQNAEGNFVSASGSVTGLTYASTQLLSVTGSPAASSGSASSPQALVAGANTFCATTCTNGNPSEQITYDFTTSLAGSIEINVNVIAGSTTTSTLYLSQASTAVGGTIVIVVDVGSATSTIQSVTVTAQQCGGSTCP
jgi:hypothetical protein